MSTSYDTLNEELNKTGVISQQFKARILSHAHRIAREAFEAGAEQEKTLMRVRNPEPGFTREQVLKLVEAAYDAVAYVGMANYSSRECEARLMIGEQVRKLGITL